MWSKKGFTLIELIVVMSIMGIISVLGISSYTNSFYKAHDARRKDDLRSIMTALQLYYNDHGKYPTAGPNCAYGQPDCFVVSGGGSVPVSGPGLGNAAWIPDLTSDYIKSLPVDPKNTGGGPWEKDGYTYAYGNVTADGQNFDLVAQLEWHDDSDTCKVKNYTKSAASGSTSWCPNGSKDPAAYLYQQATP